MRARTLTHQPNKLMFSIVKEVGVWKDFDAWQISDFRDIPGNFKF